MGQPCVCKAGLSGGMEIPRKLLLSAAWHFSGSEDGLVRLSDPDGPQAAGASSRRQRGALVLNSRAPIPVHGPRLQPYSQVFGRATQMTMAMIRIRYPRAAGLFLLAG